MPIPNVSASIADGGLGITTPSSGGITVTFGVCSKGTVGQLYGGFTDLGNVRSQLGEGPGVDALALKIAMGGGPHYFVPVLPLYDGASSTVTKVGSGAGTLSQPAFAPAEQITMVCVVAGALATAKFTFQLGSGSPSAPVTSAAGWSSTGYVVPGTLTKLVINDNNGTFDVDDTFTVSTVGVITAAAVTGDGTIDSQTSQPLNDYSIAVQILKTGVPGTGTFRFTIDYFQAEDGSDISNWSAEIIIPSGGRKYALPGTGVYLTFSNASFTAGDLHTATTIASGFNTSGVSAAFTALFALAGVEYSGGHVAGTPASASSAASLATTVDGKMVTAEAAKSFLWWFTDCPSVGSRVLSGGAPIADSADTDSTILSAFASTSSKRVSTGAGDALMISPLDGRLRRRPASWWAAARAGATIISRNIHRVKDGPLPFIARLYRDEAATEVLDAGRIVTLRTIKGKRGVYITRGRTLADSTSDFSSLARRRVMDEACRVIVAAGADLIGEDVLINANGTIQEGEAQAIEGELTAKLVSSIVDAKHSSAGTVTLSRSHNIASDSKIPITVKMVPKGSFDAVEFTFGYSIANAATTAAA